jgi:dephospho-CoA kinase
LLKVGLTGGIASGKSLVGEMFTALGVHLIQSDKVAHELIEPGERVYDKVVAEFGSGILNPDKTINRARLAEAAFGGAGPPRIELLNSIVHPEVIARENAWMDGLSSRDPHGIAMVEAALILEARAAERFDHLVVVTCRPEQRISRWAARLGVDIETARREVSRRMAAQLPDEEKIRAADYVIDNSGSLEETRKQVLEIYQKLRLQQGKKTEKTKDHKKSSPGRPQKESRLH